VLGIQTKDVSSVLISGISIIQHMWKKWLLKKLELEDMHKRVEELEETQKELTDKLLEGRPQLRHTLTLLEDTQHTKPEIVENLTDTFDISQATAYRRINELENELQYIEKTEKGYKCIVDIE
jgi:DNA repair exonuclease SbcCD ATPase subunit